MHRKKLCSVDANVLRNICRNLETILMEPNMKESDVNQEELFSEIKKFLRTESGKKTALKILLTSSVSVVSAEKLFSKLKIIKTYLRLKNQSESLFWFSFNFY
jgi:hypothetical protein